MFNALVFPDIAFPDIVAIITIIIVTIVFIFIKPIQLLIKEVRKSISMQSELSIRKNLNIVISVLSSLLLSIFSSSIIRNKLSSSARVPIAEILTAGYLRPLQICTTEFYRNRIVLFKATFGENDTVNVNFDGDRKFSVVMHGRSPVLALRSPGFREDIHLTIQLSRDFDSPKHVVADVYVDAANFTEWEDNYQDPDWSKYRVITQDHQVELDDFVKTYATYISGCIRNPIGSNG